VLCSQTRGSGAAALCLSVFPSVFCNPPPPPPPPRNVHCFRVSVVPGLNQLHTTQHFHFWHMVFQRRNYVEQEAMFSYSARTHPSKRLKCVAATRGVPPPTPPDTTPAAARC
jgi:hypothetical protein